MKQHPRPDVRKGRNAPPRRRVTQEKIDQMAVLRGQGFSHAEIGARVGCSERTSRRCVGHVQPRLRLPGPNLESETDPRALRERFLSEFMEILYREPGLRAVTMRWVKTSPDHWKAVYGDPPSVALLSEGERLIREALDGLGDIALRLMARDKQVQYRFLRDVVGSLCRDYLLWHQMQMNFCESCDGWQPRRLRHMPEFDEDEGEEL